MTRRVFCRNTIKRSQRKRIEITRQSRTLSRPNENETTIDYVPARRGAACPSKRSESRREQTNKEYANESQQLHSARYYSADGFTDHHARFITTSKSVNKCCLRF